MSKEKTRIEKATHYFGVGLRQLSHQLSDPKVMKAFQKISEALAILSEAEAG